MPRALPCLSLQPCPQPRWARRSAPVPRLPVRSPGLDLRQCGFVSAPIWLWVSPPPALSPGGLSGSRPPLAWSAISWAREELPWPAD